MNVLTLVIFVGVVDILGEAKRGKAVDEEVVLSVVGGVPFLSLGKLHKLCVCGGRVVNVLYTQYTINKMKSICTCNLIVKIHVHSLHSPTHPPTHSTHTPTPTTTHITLPPTHRIGGQFCVASFQHIMQYIQVAIHNQLELS